MVLTHFSADTSIFTPEGLIHWFLGKVSIILKIFHDVFMTDIHIISTEITWQIVAKIFSIDSQQRFSHQTTDL